MNLSTTATLGTEESGHCSGEVATTVNVRTVNQKAKSRQTDQTNFSAKQQKEEEELRRMKQHTEFSFTFFIFKLVSFMSSQASTNDNQGMIQAIERFHMTSRRPYWCSKQ